MTAPPDVPLSKGMMMIAAYREARLRQRPALRTSLHEPHLARKAARCQEQAAGEPAHALAAEPPAPVAAALPEAVEPASVFASLVSLAVAEKRTETTEAADDTAPPATQDAVADVTPPDDAARVPPEAAEPARYDPPLAEIGFGPGMLIRLSQLGLRTTGDLAHADANDLRAALGDISRLVDVEAWIANARMTASTAPADVATSVEIPA